jgi:methionyl aminopeptidase
MKHLLERLKNMVNRYDEKKIALMTEAGKICSSILKEVTSSAKRGVTLNEIDALAESLCYKNNVLPAFKGYKGFPSTVCIGIDDVVVHGIPNDYALADGDVLSIDLGIVYKGVISDTSVTIPIGTVSEETTKFINTVKESVLAGISKAKPGNFVGDIGAAMEAVALKGGYSVVKEMVGHGVGYKLHEDPNIPGYGIPGTGQELYRGQTLAIEAIINQGSPEIFISKEDGWTTYTNDGMLSALFEHTVVVDDKPRILTAW